MTGYAQHNHANRFARAIDFPVGSPLGLLAVAVIGVAVDEARVGRESIIAQSWCDLADVDPKLLKDMGVLVDHRIRVRWDI